MQVDIMLADFAEVHQNKLFITGAGINLVVVPPVEPYRVSLGVGLLITVPWTATNQNHRLRIALVDSDEQIIPVVQAFPGVTVPDEDRGAIVANFNAGRSASMEVGEDSILPVAFQFPILELPHPGSYKLAVEIDGTELSAARFRVFVPQIPVIGGISGIPMI